MPPTEAVRREPDGGARPLKPFVTYLALFFVAWALRATVFFPLDERLESPAAKAVYGNALKFVIWVVPALLYLRATGRRRPLECLRLTTRGRHLGYAVAAGVAFFAAVILFDLLVSGKRFHAPALPAAALFSIVASSVCEEILFRGFVLRELWERLGFRPANLMAAALFTLVHWPYWVWAAGGFHPGLIFISGSVFLLALFLGYLVKLTDSLWPSVVAHVVNNQLSILLRA
jgi:uncharacterized protein